MKNGRIELRNWEGRLLDGRTYSCPKERNRIISLWKSRYVHKINSCFFQIIPEVDSLRISDDGTNQKYGRKRKYQTVEKLFV
jgi:hypothetical protein